MPRISEVERQSRRSEIADAARRCFMRDGYAATSMAGIIREAGSSAGAVYCHFESKAELLRFVAVSVLQDRLRYLRGSLREYDGELTASVVADVLMSAAPMPEDAALLVQMWAQTPADPDLAEAAEGTVRALRKIVRSELEPWAQTRFGTKARTRAGEAADAVIAAVHGYVVRCVLNPHADLAEVRRRIVAGLSATAA